MKSIVFAALLAVAVAIPQGEVRILRQNFDIDQQGNYEHGYQQDNGQVVNEVGRVEPGPEPETGSITVEGSYQYVGPDGKTYAVTYQAGKNGFQPELDHKVEAPAQIPAYQQLKNEHPELFWAVNL